MKAFATTLILLVVAGMTVFGADIDGKWKSENKRPARNGGSPTTITLLFTLKADGANLTGTVDISGGPRGDHQVAISDGKIDGNKYTFTVVNQTPNGLVTTKYECTVEGDLLKGTAMRQGAPQSRPFEAKKQ
ncbi:MAG: hypothetical protein ACLQBJ_00220 [Bryobacteraceae bacterium]